MSSIRWLHISDLHFGSLDKSRKTIRESLVEFVKKKIETEKWALDYLFITGDLIFAKEIRTSEARKKAYEEAYEYISQLYKIIWNSDSTEGMWDRVFIVPGNHDVIRNESRSANIVGILKYYKQHKYEDIDSSFEQDFSSGISDFLSNVPEGRKKAHSEVMSAKHFVLKTDKVNILHINSCISSGEDGEEGKLILGSNLLEKALDEIDKSLPTIAISHHNIDFLDREEQKKIEILLKKHNIYLLLCGHTHARESNLILRYNQSKVLYTFTAGALMNEGEECDVVILKGELNFDDKEGLVYSYKWTKDFDWTDDNDFGLAQGENQLNKRFIRSEIIDSPYYMRINENSSRKNQTGVNSIIVSHTAPERTRAFTDVNERAKNSLSVYGIGITHVSKDKGLMERILKSGGSIRLCMMDPTVFKKGKCEHLIIEQKALSSMKIKIENCDIDKLHFCIGATHMDDYIRDEYAEDVLKSFERLKKYKEEVDLKDWDFKIRLLRSFVPISINIINEKNDDAELIAEYNMPFVEKRLLLQADKKLNNEYYTQLVGVFEAIWNQSEEV